MKTLIGVLIGFVLLCILNLAYARQTHCYNAMGSRYCETY